MSQRLDKRETLRRAQTTPAGDNHVGVLDIHALFLIVDELQDAGFGVLLVQRYLLADNLTGRIGVVRWHRENARAHARHLRVVFAADDGRHNITAKRRTRRQ